MPSLVKFKTGTRAAFDALSTKDNDTLYFLNDTFQIFKGANLYCKSFATVNTLPATGVKDTLYVVKNEKKLYIYNGTAFVEALDASVTVDSAVTDTSTNPVTSAAIYSFVTSEIANLTGGSTNAFVTSIIAGTELGALKVSKGDETTDVALKLSGIVTTPSYDATTRKFTFPVIDGDDVVVSLGKDLVVTNGTYDATNKKIILTIAGGGDAGADKTIEIPVGDLVDTYTASTDATGAVKITITDNAIKGAVVVDGTTVKIANGKLTADFSTLVTTETFNALKTQVEANKTAIETLTTNVNTKVSAIEGRLDTAESEIETIKTDYVTSQYLQSNYYNNTTIDSKISTLNTAINKVADDTAAALTWVTIE